jgi:transcriptional regulator with XRE-family HTH domain
MSNLHNKPTLGAIFRQKREEKGLLIRQVAAVTEMDQALVSHIENGYRLPTKDQLYKLAGLYDLDFKLTYSSWLAERMIRDYGDEPLAPEAFRDAHEQVILKHSSLSEPEADYDPFTVNFSKSKRPPRKPGNNSSQT